MSKPDPNARPSASGARSKACGYGRAVLVAAAAGAAIFAAAAFATGPRPPSEVLAAGKPERGGQGPVQGPPPWDGVIDLAGSGSNLPSVRVLADRFEQRMEIAVRVHASLGSSGGLAALADARIDAALVSRPLRPSERARGFHPTLYARVPVAVAVNARSPLRTMDGPTLLRIVAGELRRHADGTPVVFVMREPGDSSFAAMAEVVPGFAAAVEKARREALHPVAVHDGDVWPILEGEPGAVAIVAEGDLRVRPWVRPLPLFGVAPTMANVTTGRYRPTKPLQVVTVGPPSGAVARFTAFLRSDEARGILREMGYAPPLPVPGAPLRPPVPPGGPLHAPAVSPPDP